MAGPVNAAPVVSLITSPLSANVPFDATADASGSTDPDGDELTFGWFLNSERIDHTDPVLTRAITDSGVWEFKVRVSDGYVTVEKTAVVQALPQLTSKQEKAIEDLLDLEARLIQSFRELDNKATDQEEFASRADWDKAVEKVGLIHEEFIAWCEGKSNLLPELSAAATEYEMKLRPVYKKLKSLNDKDFVDDDDFATVARVWNDLETERKSFAEGRTQFRELLDTKWRLTNR